MGKKRRELLTPVIEGATLELATPDAPGGLTFRKRILPLGAITYTDRDGTSRRVNFDSAYHQTVIDAFGSQAVECPTVQLADARNGHNMDITRTAGEVTALSHQQDGDTDGPGLYATIRARNAEHAKLLHEMPKLGVSANIKEYVKRVDGSKFRAALQHILVTGDPRVVGLGPWRPVSLSSADDGPTIDLSELDYDEETTVGKQKATEQADDFVSLSDEELEAALQEAADALGEQDDDVSLSDEQADDGQAGRTREAYLSLSARMNESTIELSAVQARLAAADWRAERLELSNAGVPKLLLDEAGEILGYTGENTVSLSDDSGRPFEADARKVIRNMLELCRGAIPMGEPKGSPHSEPISLSEEDADDMKKFTESERARAGF